MDKNIEKGITPEIIANMYISMTPEQEKQFWELLTKELSRYYDKKRKSEKSINQYTT